MYNRPSWWLGQQDPEEGLDYDDLDLQPGSSVPEEEMKRVTAQTRADILKAVGSTDPLPVKG